MTVDYNYGAKLRRVCPVCNKPPPFVRATRKVSDRNACVACDLRVREKGRKVK